MTLSTKLNHLPPLTPLPSAETTRSVQIDASTHHRPGGFPLAASLPCVASSALPEFSCVIPVVSPPTSYLPSRGAVLLAAPLSVLPNGVGIMKVLTPTGLTRARSEEHTSELQSP